MENLQQAWDMIAEHLVQQSNNPKSPSICFYVHRDVNYKSHTFCISMSTGGYDSANILVSKEFPWAVK